MGVQLSCFPFRPLLYGRIRICEELDNQIGSPFLLRFLVFYLIKQNHVNCGLFTPSFTPFTHISPFHFFRRVRLTGTINTIFVALRTENVLRDAVNPHGSTYFLSLRSWWSSRSVLARLTLQEIDSKSIELRKKCLVF